MSASQTWSGLDLPRLHGQCCAAEAAAWNAATFCSGVIPTRLKSDTRPLPAADGAYAFGIVDQEVPGLSASVDDVVVGVPDPGAELVLSQVVPDVFHRVQLGTVGWQGKQGEIGRHLQLLATLVPASPVADQDGTRTWGYLGAEFLQVRFIASVFAWGTLIAAPTPRAGQIAPNK